MGLKSQSLSDVIFQGLDMRAGGSFYDGGDYIYFLGGRDQPTTIQRFGVRTWHMFDPNSWTTEVMAAQAPVVGWAGYGWTGSKYYIGGGVLQWVEGFPQDKIWSYTPSLDLVEEVATLPTTLFDTTGLWNPSSQKFYLFAGFINGQGPDGSGGSFDDGILEFDPATGLVTKIGTLPHAGDNGAAAYNPDAQVMYWVGGHTGNTFHDSIVGVLPDGNNQIVGTMPEGVDSLGAAFHAGKLYIFGGRNRVGGVSQDSDKIYEFDPSTGCVTTLAETLLNPQLIYNYAVGPGAVYLLSGNPRAALVPD